MSIPTFDQKIPSIPFIPLEKKLPLKEKLKPQKVLLIAGPTACGKTALSLLLAELLPGEIISADSCQIYRGMDVGTAKVSKKEQAEVPHHLIDIRHIQESFNVVDYYYTAKQAIESILARGSVPIVVGGSGFYFRSLLYGPPAGPPSVPEVRQALEQEMEQLGPEALYQKLTAHDRDYAATITKNDRQKVIRALEIITLTGEKVSALKWKQSEPLSDYDYRAWFLFRPRPILYNRIDERCEKMLKKNFLDEVQNLKIQGLRQNRQASQAIGYRQALDYLETDQTEDDYAAFVEDFKRASRHLAKRQFTWFRKEPAFRWLNIEAHDFEIAADLILQEFVS